MQRLGRRRLLRLDEANNLCGPLDVVRVDAAVLRGDELEQVRRLLVGERRPCLPELTGDQLQRLLVVVLSGGEVGGRVWRRHGVVIVDVHHVLVIFLPCASPNKSR